MAGIVLEGHGIAKAFGAGPARTVVLDGIDCVFSHGEIALLMGPSGSGKSTLLAILSGLLRPDSGTVMAPIGRLDLLSEAELARWRLHSVGFVFQQDNLLPSLTIRQQMEMLLIWGLGSAAGPARRRIDEVLGMLGIAGKANLHPAALSGGEKQRASIARALLKRPMFCFADEPTSALDWKTGRTVVEALRSAAHDNGMTTIVVTHDQRLLPFADKVYNLEDGRLASCPPPETMASP